MTTPEPRARHEDLKYLFVVTYGRSGSTLVQGILNSIPGYLIRGENRQALRHLREFETVVRRERAQQVRQRDREADGAPRGPSHPFFGIDELPRGRLRRDLRRLVVDSLLRPEPDTRVTGFKEIRWYDEDAADFVAWLRDVFPGARFVVNTRRLTDVARSKWWADDPDALERLHGIEARMLAIADELGEAAYRVHYDDFVADPDCLRGFFDWLGEPWDPAAVHRVLGRRHST